MAIQDGAAAPPIGASPVKCAICAHEGHILQQHLKAAHEMTVAEYQTAHPGQPIMSALGEYALQQKKGQTVALALPVPDAAPASLLSIVPAGYTIAQESILKLFSRGIGENHDRDVPVKIVKGLTQAHGVPAIDQHYSFPDVFRYFIMAMEHGKGLVYLFGPTGSGKTSLAEQFAARTGRPFGRIQIHAQMEMAEIIGSPIIDDTGKVVFNYAMLPILMQMPSVICLDEYDSGNPIISAILNAVLEGKPLVIPHTRERINLHPDAKIVATGNTTGMGDETGLYTSTSVQSFATMDRFEQYLELDYLDHEIESAMLKRRFPDVHPSALDNIVKYANMIRQGFKQHSVSVTLSTRSLASWLKWYGMTVDQVGTYHISFANRLVGSDRAFCDEAFQRVFGQDPNEKKKKAAKIPGAASRAAA